MTADKTIAALWAFDTVGRYPPQFVGAVSESLRDAWYEESERLRELAERWFSDFDDEPEHPDRWTFDILYHHVPVPTPAPSRTDQTSAGPSSDRPSTSDAVPSGPDSSDGRPR